MKIGTLSEFSLVKSLFLRFKIAKVYVFGAISHCKMMVLVRYWREKLQFWSNKYRFYKGKLRRRRENFTFFDFKNRFCKGKSRRRREKNEIFEVKTRFYEAKIGKLSSFQNLKSGK